MHNFNISSVKNIFDMILTLTNRLLHEFDKFEEIANFIFASIFI